jgi:hypothetical protein
MLQLLHTHSYCADFMNTTVRQATSLHQSELQLNITLATLYSLFFTIISSIYIHHMLLANGVCTLPTSLFTVSVSNLIIQVTAL